jgi:hypothetical protein
MSERKIPGGVFGALYAKNHDTKLVFTDRGGLAVFTVCPAMFAYVVLTAYQQGSSESKS